MLHGMLLPPLAAWCANPPPSPHSPHSQHARLHVAAPALQYCVNYSAARRFQHEAWKQAAIF
eukprot:264799-Chlamydomonas_euryale.AAC.1